MHKFDITTSIYSSFSVSLCLFGEEEVVTSRFKSTVMQIISQLKNDRVNVKNSEGFTFIGFLVL